MEFEKYFDETIIPCPKKLHLMVHSMLDGTGYNNSILLILWNKFISEQSLNRVFMKMPESWAEIPNSI